MNNNGTRTGNPFDDTSSDVPVNPLESNSEIWHEPGHEEIGIPLPSVGSHRGGYQDGIGSFTATHQPQTISPTPSHSNEPSYASSTIPNKLTVILQMEDQGNPLEDPPPSYHPNSGP